MPEVQIRRRRIKTGLNTQRLTALELFNQRGPLQIQQLGGLSLVALRSLYEELNSSPQETWLENSLR